MLLMTVVPMNIEKSFAIDDDFDDYDNYDDEYYEDED